LPPGIFAQWQEEGVIFDSVQRDWLWPGFVFELKLHPPLTTLKSGRVRSIPNRGGTKALDRSAARRENATPSAALAPSPS
jgi:hypothetical protein